MDVLFVRSSVYALPSQQRVDAIVYDGAADMELWPGRGPDSDLREAYGSNLAETLRATRARLDGEELPLGEGVRVHPGRLHCDFLLWMATRPPEPGTTRQPAPGAELLERSVDWALRFAAERSARRVAFPNLGAGPDALDPAERLERIVRTARRYEERCFAEGRSAVLEEVLVCEPDGPTLRAAERRVHRLAKAAAAPEPRPTSDAKPATRKSGTRSGGSSTGRASGTKRSRAKGPPPLDAGEIQNAKASAAPYDRTKTYAVGDWFMHPKFGAGKVEQVVPGGAIMVRFEDGSERKMLHARS
jgi:O-acetyl-ADP-ribose deacetylase (regulator of RNase III)